MSYKDITEDELKLFASKNDDYTRGGDEWGNFNRVADILSNYPNLKLGNPVVVCLVYMMKQLDASLWMLNKDYEGGIENIDTRLRDVHIYAKIARCLKGEL